MPDYAGPGEETVDRVEVTASLPGDRTLDLTICRPEGTGRPLVVISPGFQMARDQYASYCQHLASWGYPTILLSYAALFPDHGESARDLSKLLDWAREADALQAWDEQRVAAAGHSLGGKISLLTATQDPRLGLVVGWDPVDAGTPSVTPQRMDTMSAPLVLLGEITDSSSGGGQACAPAAENYAAYFEAATAPAYEVTLVGADHMDFVDDPSCLACGFCRDGAAEREVVRAITRRTTVAAVRRFLDDELSAESWLDGEGIASDVAAGLVSLRVK